jgi:hypothetical protein
MHLDDGKKALEDRRYAVAFGLFQAAIKESGRQDFGYTKDQASTLSQEAASAQARLDGAAKRETALKLVEDAKALASSDDIPAAFQKLREARNADPQVAGAPDLMARLQEQAQVQGERALTSAKNYDRYKRTEDAIKEFDKAVQLLELISGGHKDLAFARQRSAELKALR